jgi:hypothetical protein
MPENFPHLKIDSFYSSKDYVYPKIGGGSEFDIVERNRNLQGNRIIQQLNRVRDQFQINRDEELPPSIVRDDVVYVEFYSEWNFPLKFESLNQDREEPLYQILTVKKETSQRNGEEAERFRVVVMMKEGAVSTFLSKAAKYLTENTRDKLGNDTGKPKNEPLIANIQSIELATLKSFWSDEPEFDFPENEEVVWWEVWFRRTNDDAHRIARVIQNLQAIGAQIGEQQLQFPEHIVKLVRGSAIQLASSLPLLDSLAELRKPQQLNDFITNRQVDIKEKREWIEDLKRRTEFKIDENSVVICLLDSGVNNKHPLLIDVLPDSRLYTYKNAWGKEDSWIEGGHGTGMSGLALYGDLTRVIESKDSVRIFHGIESFKIIHPADPNDPKLYGAITEYACSTPIVDNPKNLRIFCLSITDGQLAFKGRPSTWSASIDRITFGLNGNADPQLFIVSGGNVSYMEPGIDANSYPDKNHIESIHDPAQSYNAVTVGTYTRMDRIDQNAWPGIRALALDGGMSPSNSTSLLWENQWPIKPDIVMEGGNLAVQGIQVLDHIPTLKPLSLDKDFTNYLLYPFGDTSGAAALACKMAAELRTAYPTYWPETIRALLVHSANWTQAMLNGIDILNASVVEKRALLRSFGYGVPNLQEAMYNAKNSLTLIAENEIQPYRFDGSSVKYNKYHLYEIPWPIDILQGVLADKDVKLILTLSYFIDPNPGNRRYANNFSYHSHSLDFKMIRPTEDINQFKRRISAAAENQETSFNGQDEPWLLKEAVRSKGSLKKDFVISSGADLATRKFIAIYPKGGWYNSRKRLGMVEKNVRYSLIISMQSEELDVDIYTPIFEQINNTLASM